MRHGNAAIVPTDELPAGCRQVPALFVAGNAGSVRRRTVGRSGRTAPRFEPLGPIVNPLRKPFLLYATLVSSRKAHGPTARRPNDGKAPPTGGEMGMIAQPMLRLPIPDIGVVTA